MKAVIFLGPSLSLDEARETLDAIYLPPAAQTDLVTAAVNHKPDVIGLIDGVFLQSLSVWHKEIMYVLEHEIPIYGASSMGALRAAETAAFGMIGVGEIFRQYSSGELMDDDEVALAHTSGAQGYTKVSEPMVNVRATYLAAQQAGIINAEQRSRLIAIGKAIFFAERTFYHIHNNAAAEGMPDSTLERLATFVRSNYVDLKRQDALELLRKIKCLEGSCGPHSTALPFVPRHSTAFETLYNRDRRVECGRSSVPLECISNYVALHDPDFDELNFNTLNRISVFAFSEVLGIEPSDNEIDTEFERFRKSRGLVDDVMLSAWLLENHLSHEEVRELMALRAACRSVHRWLLIAMWMGRTTKAVLDELRLKGTYRQWAERAAAQEHLLGGDFPADGEGVGTTLEEFLDEHCEWTGRRLDIDPAVWAEEAGFHSEHNFKMELCRSSSARRALLELLSNALPAT